MNSSLLVLNFWLIHLFLDNTVLVLDQEFVKKYLTHWRLKKKIKPINTVRFCLMELKQDIDHYVKGKSWE